MRQEGQVLVVERPDDERRSRSLHGLTRTLVSNMVVGVTSGFAKDLEIVGVGYRVTPKGPTTLELALGFSHSITVEAPVGHHLRGALAYPHNDPRQRQASRGRSGGQDPQAPPARALQGQGRALRRRSGPAQGRQGCEVRHQMSNVKDKQSARARRHFRVRKKVRGTQARPRLAVFRSNQHVIAQVIDDVSGRTLAAASSLEAGVRERRDRPATAPPRRRWANWWPKGPRPPG